MCQGCVLTHAEAFEHPIITNVVILQDAGVQDFMLGNKLFIVCEYVPYSLLQLLEGTAEPTDPSSNPPPPGQLWQHGLSSGYVTTYCSTQAF